MKYRITAFLFLVILMTLAFNNWRQFFQHRTDLLEDFANETDLAGIIEDADQYIQDNIYGEYVCIEAYGAIQKVLLKHEVNAFDEVIDKSGYLHSGNFYTEFPDDQKKISINIRKLSDFSQEHGSCFLFTVTPMKIAMEENRYMGIPYNDFSKAADDLMRYLRYYNVENLDMRETILQSGLSYEDIYYKTDHHWKTPAAFEGYKALANWLNEKEDVALYRIQETTNLAYYHIA